MTTILRPDHFTIVTDDLDATEAFYTELLGLTVGSRPDFKFPGLWFYANEAAILHVVKVEDMPTSRKGCLLYTSPSPRDATLSRMPSSA